MLELRKSDRSDFSQFESLAYLWHYEITGARKEGAEMVARPGITMWSDLHQPIWLTIAVIIETTLFSLKSGCQ
jgi:hypothetical protein